MEGLPLLQGNAELGPLNLIPSRVCDSAPKRAQSVDILLSVRAPVGAMNIAGRAYGIGRGHCSIRPGTHIIRTFCFYQIMTMRTLLVAGATGSSYDAVTASNVGDLPLLLPDRGEQSTIAAFLDRETARIDALVAKKQRLLELLQEKRTALMTRAVTRGSARSSGPLKEGRATGSYAFPLVPKGPKGWKLWKLRRLIRQVRRPIVVRPDQECQEIGIRSWGKGIFHKEPIRGTLLGEKSMFRPEPGDFVLNIVFAWEGAVAVVSQIREDIRLHHIGCRPSVRLPT